MITRSSHRAAVLRLTLPPLAALLLFAAASYFLLLPATHEALLERKRETLRAIVASAISLCERHHAAEQAGALSSAEARLRAAEDLRALRYGEANKDYLWIIDHDARMIAHPYRKDLEGQILASHTDPDGVRIFAESVSLVSRQTEGFLHYRWQWQDDASRIVPKLSFVRGFAPWGWVIGSGIYLDDVDAEIARSTRHLLEISAGIAAFLAILIALALRQGLLSEAQRQEAESELRRSTARYQALAQAADEAVWLVSHETVSAANRSACRLFGLSEAELLGRPATSLFAPGSTEPSPGQPGECMLASATGPVPVLLTASSATLQGRSARVLTARDLRQGRRPDHDESQRRETAESMLDESLLHGLNWLLPAAALAQPATLLPLSSSQAELKTALQHAPGGCILLSAPDGGVCGIVSSADLLRREDSTAYAAMSAPVHQIRPEASLADAADALASNPGHHLLMASENPAIIDASSVLEALRHNPLQLAARIEQAGQDELPALRQRMLQWLRGLIQLGVNPEILARESTRLADALLRRCIALTLAELGPAPGAFEIIVVGSQGRGEMMPTSDQDNALIHADGADPHWFSAFAQQLVARYAAAGWPRCEGGTTCANPRWCLPVSAWQAQFSSWIDSGSPQSLLEIATFFDFRSLQPDSPLSETLRAHVSEAVREREVFLHQLSQAALELRTPLNPFGAIRGDDTHGKALDLKSCLLHYVSFARIEALRHGLLHTGTGDRLRALRSAGKLAPALASETLAAWQHLLGLRLHTNIQPGKDDFIQLAELDDWRSTQLKRALAHTATLHNQLRHEMERHA